MLQLQSVTLYVRSWWLDLRVDPSIHISRKRFMTKRAEIRIVSRLMWLAEHDVKYNWFIFFVSWAAATSCWNDTVQCSYVSVFSISLFRITEREIKMLQMNFSCQSFVSARSNTSHLSAFDRSSADRRSELDCRLQTCRSLRVIWGFGQQNSSQLAAGCRDVMNVGSEVCWNVCSNNSSSQCREGMRSVDW